MTITGTSQDFIYGAVGGLMIGVAASMFLLINGRIMGASGILGGLVDGSGRANFWERAAFVAGVVGAPAIVALIYKHLDAHVTSNMVAIIAGGIIVGVGTRMANGCTSGHGVCGISRFSRRGIVATLLYLFFGALTMFVLRHGLGWI